MNFGELKTALIEDTHRSDLTSLAPRFVREAEGMIRRELIAYPLSTTLTDSDRVAAGVFNLPVRCQQIRTIHLQGRQGDALQRVSPAAIRRMDTTADVLQYAELGNDTIEFRGTPGSSDVFDVLYFGSPAALSADGDTNDLLTDHESIYLEAAKFFLYLHTQDRELASDALEVYQGVKDTLNEQMARKMGGASVAPSYNFAGGSSY